MCSVVEAYQQKYEDGFVGDEDLFSVVFVKRKHYKLTNLILDDCNIATVGSGDKV